jgi:hypothetical protein
MYIFSIRIRKYKLEAFSSVRIYTSWKMRQMFRLGFNTSGARRWSIAAEIRSPIVNIFAKLMFVYSMLLNCVRQYKK